MQNKAMIGQEQERMTPLVEQLTGGLDPEQADIVAGTVLNKAVNIRRGLACGRGVSGLCIDCTEIGATDPPICDARALRMQTERAEDRQRIIQSVHVNGTTLFTVDV